jgi:hypothetical protein
VVLVLLARVVRCDLYVDVRGGEVALKLGGALGKGYDDGIGFGEKGSGACAPLVLDGLAVVAADDRLLEQRLSMA